jgi:hypothetical protein
MTISWDVQNNTLHDLSISFHGPPYNLGRQQLVQSHTFDQAEPTLTIMGTGSVGLDGTYYVTVIDDEFIWVHEDLEFAVIWMKQ